MIAKISENGAGEMRGQHTYLPCMQPISARPKTNLFYSQKMQEIKKEAEAQTFISQ